MSNRFKKSAFIIALSGAAAMAGVAYAQTDTTASNAPIAVVAQASPATVANKGDKSDWLDMGQIYDRVEAAGYTDVREIEREKKGYEVKAKDSEGRSVKLYIDPVDGKIVKEKVRDQDDD